MTTSPPSGETGEFLPLEKLKQQALSAADGIDHLQNSSALRRRTAEILREMVAALTRAQPQAGEAVGWRYRKKGNPTWTFASECPDWAPLSPEIEFEPLYTRPTPTETAAHRVQEDQLARSLCDVLSVNPDAMFYNERDDRHDPTFTVFLGQARALLERYEIRKRGSQPEPSVCDQVQASSAPTFQRPSKEEARQAIVRIINPDLFVEYDLLVAKNQTAANGKPWHDVVFGKRIEELLAKADTILFLLSQPSPSVCDQTRGGRDNIVRMLVAFDGSAMFELAEQDIEKYGNLADRLMELLTPSMHGGGLTVRNSGATCDDN